MAPVNDSNNSIENENYPYQVEQALFAKLGSFDWWVDQVFLYFMIPLAIICSLLNILTMIGLRRLNSKKCLIYKYMKVYTLVSILICISVFLSCLQHLPRYWAFSKSYIARVYTCYMGLIFNNTMFFFGNILNILIILERLFYLL